ncbi:hypothetical protein Q4595_16155 [Wenyingzhuangia sp. 1_MG-2023]|nr:hypothetical protein [Wenyingzhuangia sp. 1_MG-2023]
MKKNILIFTLSIIFSACSQNKDSFKKSEFYFESVQEQADSLVYFMEKSFETKNLKWEHKFFNAFPETFSGMEKIFGYDDIKGEAPLYSSEKYFGKYLDKRIMSNIIGYFSEIKSVPNFNYIEKYINININGKWEADNIQNGFGIYYLIIDRTKEFVEIASNFSKTEMKSVFKFIFDSPHPKNAYNEKLFESLNIEIKKYDNRLSIILTEAYNELIIEKNHHD